MPMALQDGRDRLSLQLRAAGLSRSDNVIVHAAGGALPENCAAAIIDAIALCIGPKGTVVIPTFSSDALMPPLSLRQSSDARLRAERTVPGYDALSSPADLSGPLGEAFRTLPGVLRSNHPVFSLAARGPWASDIVERHPRDWALGVDGPMGRLLEMPNMRVLLIGGAAWLDCPVMVLAESMARHRRLAVMRFKERLSGRWIHARDIAVDREGIYDRIGRELGEIGLLRRAPLGRTVVEVASMDEMVGYAAPRIAEAVGEIADRPTALASATAG
ncbi:MAG: AAC(3) family N-acetyltransferase [Pseudomonadota bacterium]